MANQSQTAAFVVTREHRRLASTFRHAAKLAEEGALSAEVLDFYVRAAMDLVKREA